MQENIIKISNALASRYDPLYYNTIDTLKIVNSTKFIVKKLNDVAYMQRGRFGHRPRNDPKLYNGQYPFIQTGDIVKASLDNGEIPYSQTLNEDGLATSKMFYPETLIITIAANIGDTAILTYPACFPDSLVALESKFNDLNIKYLNYYLKYLKPYLENMAPRAVQKNINLQQLAPVPIIVPPINVQNYIISIMDKAYESKRRKEKEAEQILLSIDGYVLNTLGIQSSDYKKEKNYKVRISDILNSRLDPEYNQPYFEHIMSEIQQNNNTIALSDLVYSGGSENMDIYNKINYIDLGAIDDKFNTITYKEVEKKDFPNRAKLKVQQGDLLVSSLAGSIKSIAVITDNKDSMIASTGFFVINPGKNHSNHYLFALLKTTFMQNILVRHASGAVMPAINTQELKNIKIPLPRLDIQEKIAKNVQNMIKDARRLKEEAVLSLNEAKLQVEKLLLGE
jgi:restriction endonuclease S subunit